MGNSGLQVTIAAVLPTNEAVVNLGESADETRDMHYSLRQQPLILIVDHQPDLLQEAAAALMADGYACDFCTNADAALESALNQVPDAILCDLNLGGETGLMLRERLLREDSLRDVPVMFLSQSQIPDIIHRRHEPGSSYYLRKPCDPQVLLELIHNALGSPLASSQSCRS